MAATTQEAGGVVGGERKRSRKRRWIIAALALLAFLVIGCVLVWFLGGRAYFRGVTRAREDLRNGRAILLELRCDLGGDLDVTTGLTVYGTGYPIGDTRYYVQGYNGEVRRYIRKHGPPANAKKPWTSILLGLPEYWKKQSQRSAPAVLEPNGGPIESQGSRLLLTRYRRPERYQPDRWYVQEELWLWPAPDSEVLTPYIGRNGIQTIECLWGPPDGGFAVLRFTTDHGTYLRALDLRNGKWLGTEPARNPP